MAKSNTTLKEILEKGTPKQKALLIIKNDEESQQIGAKTLSEAEIKAIVKTLDKNPEEKREFNKYLRFAQVYSLNRFRLYGLNENLYKFHARITSYLYLWEQAEREVELVNALLNHIEEGSKAEELLYKRLKRWHRLISIERTENSREVEANLVELRGVLDSEITAYTHSLGVAKAMVQASDIFIKRHNAISFVPEDIRGMLHFFRNPNEELPELYRRDRYLQLKEERGAEDREVKFREKYAIIPAIEEIPTIGLDEIKESFRL